MWFDWKHTAPIRSALPNLLLLLRLIRCGHVVDPSFEDDDHTLA